MSTAFIFPGQGSQHVGMGKDFYNQYEFIYEELFEEANDILGVDLKNFCFSGPNDQLTATQIAQPAIVTSSIGMYRLLKSEGITPNVVAGHSVGQFSALVAAGSLTFADALQIVHQRGKCMAAVKKLGNMVAVVGSREEQLEEVLEKAFDFGVEMSAHNSPIQVVFSGELEKIAKFKQSVDEIPGIKTKLLNVSQAFHSSLMQEMEQEFMDYIYQFSVEDAAIPVILNCNAKVATNKNEILEDIQLQCTRPVLWRQTIDCLSTFDTTDIFEVGPSKNLSGLLRAFDLQDVVTISTESVMSYKKNMKKVKKLSLQV
ncbi:ACP S-malonyltransferase [Paenisporosarcina indica]|uniref:ACP S-malonyltransferase n=1 Tax=Paenisporosarcina indica TaxID=650093 RepID=UPI00095009B9|nr:ACP S-malonyltransferase [Paenisporosarcina indica]